MATYELVRNGDVEVVKRYDDKKRPMAVITVDGTYQHTFPTTSRISKHLDMMEAEDLSHRLTGGSFFFVEGELVDFRDGSYNGFVHDDKTIEVFMDILGYQRRADLTLPHIRKIYSGDDASEVENSPIILRKIWNENGIEVPGYAGGADFNSILSFGWNPYMKHVNTLFDLVRLICTNGMVGVTSFLNTKVPLFNRWEQHLDIAARQVQNKVNGIVVDRVKFLSNSVANVGDCLLLEDHISKRMQNELDAMERKRLLNMLNAVSPSLQLGHVYRDSVFEDRNRAAQLPAHLTNFDVYNVATELRTHHKATAASTDFALDKFANHLLFDREGDITTGAKRYGKKTVSAFSSAEHAFFGEITV